MGAPGLCNACLNSIALFIIMLVFHVFTSIVQWGGMYAHMDLRTISILLVKCLRMTRSATIVDRKFNSHESLC
jgi:hypothetical protein